MRTLVDVDGLSLLPTRRERESFAIALGYDKSSFIQESDRLSMLSALAKGRNTELVLGPQGKEFWSLISPECFIRVEPDGYPWNYRTTNLEEWSLLASGFSPTEVKALIAHPPTQKAKAYGRYQAAKALQDAYSDVCKAAGDVETDEVDVDDHLTIIRDIEAQVAFLDQINELVALDLEWVIEENNRAKQLIGLNVSSAGSNWYLPILGAGFNQSSSQEVFQRQLWALCLRQPTIWHNAKADIQAGYLGDPLDLSDCIIHDTILMAYVAGEGDLGLKHLSEKLLGRKSVPLPSKLEDMPVELAARYGALGDTRNTYDLFMLLKAKLESTNQWDVYNKIERPLVPLIASMEKYGIPLDISEVKKLREDYANQQDAIRHNISSKFKLDFRIPKDQKSYMGRHGFHSNSLAKGVLSKITASWVEPLQEYRELETLKNNFLDKHIKSWTDTGCPNNYNLYPSFNQAGRDSGDDSGWTNAPATGRLSSAGPNLQNQPRAIRSAFTSPNGFKLVSLDYASLELRLAASISEDPVMLGVFQSGGDLHQYMRDIILKETSIDVGRPTAKTANFNLRYGGQADMLMTIAAKQGAHLTYEVAKSIVDLDRSTYSGYWKWFNSVVDNARKQGYSASLEGRRRYNKDLLSSDQIRRGHAERAAANMVIQGTGADIIKTAMIKLIPILKYFKAHLALQVHDELVFWVPEDVAQRFFVAAKGIMESIQISHLSLVVEGGIADNWAEAH